MTVSNIKLDIQKEIERLKEVQGNDNWRAARAIDLFDRRVVSTPTGNRVCYVPQSALHNKNLQCSRGLSVDDVEVAEDLQPEYEQGMVLSSIDKVRINEYDVILDAINRERSEAPLEIKGMCEFGFRWPRLMNYYMKEHGCTARGYDVSSASVSLGQLNGFDTRECDLNNVDNGGRDSGIDLKGINFVCIYHVLEHVVAPLATLKMLYDLAEPGTFFHIEVPIEKDAPQPEYGHLFGFHHFDLVKYAQSVGFQMVANTTYQFLNGAVLSDRVCMYRP